jgi:hypothetical protein
VRELGSCSLHEEGLKRFSKKKRFAREKGFSLERASPELRWKKYISKIRCFECHDYGHYASQCPH